MNLSPSNNPHLYHLITSMKHFILLLLFSTTAFAQSRVDGFFKGAGNTQLVAGGGAELGQLYYAGKNEVEGLARDVFNVNFLVATGITDYLDIYLSAPYIIINEQKSIQDGSVFLKVRLAQKRIKKGNLTLSFAAGFSAPLAPYKTEEFNAIGQQAKVFDFRPVLHYKLDNGWFATAQGAYLEKLDSVPDAANVGLKVGRATSKIYYDVWYDHQTTFGGFDYQGTPAPPSFRQLGVDYHKVGFTVYKNVATKLGVFMGASYVLAGRNVNKGVGLSAGFVYQP